MTDPITTQSTTARTIDESRRTFLKSGSAALAGGMAVTSLTALSPSVYASGSDILRVGLIGAGGRGTGAASQALHADTKTELVAVADAFPETAVRSIERLKADKSIVGQIKVADDHVFGGLNGYKQVVEMVDVVLLATPPGFRPMHFRAAVDAGKHVFTEKPMATDPVGVQSVFESVAISKEKNLAVLAGFCWRYEFQKKALFERVLDGEIGDVRAVYGTYLTSPVKPMPPVSTRPEGMSDIEWMVRNWYNFTWLSGDGLVEQACHTVDWIAWAMGDRPPASVTAVGGRQLPAHGGNIFDHIELNFVWDNDARGFLSQRQIPGCHNENLCTILGTTGTGKIGRRGSTINDLTGKETWKYDGPKRDMYQQEHDEFFASIRSGNHINDGDRMVNSTMMAIMGRMAGYTGKEVTWEMAMNSKLSLVPDVSNGWDSKVEFRPTALPGVTPFV
ncbi:MAG: Gfo/Idh/MocA family oxidoreductase [Planctomycetota bacterium]|nr:Gfo/Idh/MocA family oxidoreductase [Planctomycetota bacterium]